jgi:hypothetical protein
MQPPLGLVGERGRLKALQTLKDIGARTPTAQRVDQEAYARPHQDAGGNHFGQAHDPKH